MPDLGLFKGEPDLGVALAGEGLVGGPVPTDMQAARSTGIDSIGYANKPGKTDTLAEADATAVVTSLAELVLPLRARPLPN